MFFCGYHVGCKLANWVLTSTFPKRMFFPHVSVLGEIWPTLGATPLRAESSTFHAWFSFVWAQTFRATQLMWTLTKLNYSVYAWSFPSNATKMYVVGHCLLWCPDTALKKFEKIVEQASTPKLVIIPIKDFCVFHVYWFWIIYKKTLYFFFRVGLGEALKWKHPNSSRSFLALINHSLQLQHL